MRGAITTKQSNRIFRVLEAVSFAMTSFIVSEFMEHFTGEQSISQSQLTLAMPRGRGFMR